MSPTWNGDDVEDDWGGWDEVDSGRDFRGYEIDIPGPNDTPMGSTSSDIESVYSVSFSFSSSGSSFCRDSRAQIRGPSPGRDPFADPSELNRPPPSFIDLFLSHHDQPEDDTDTFSSGVPSSFRETSSDFDDHSEAAATVGKLPAKKASKPRFENQLTFKFRLKM